MLLKLKDSQNLVELVNSEDLFNPFVHRLKAMRLKGEEQQEAELFHKSELCFASGEALPKCWTNEHYRDAEWLPHMQGASSSRDFSWYGS